MTERVRRGPKYKIQDSDWPKIEAACKIHCTREEICAMFGVEQDTLEAAIRRKYGYRKFSSFYKANAAGGKMSLRRAQYNLAVNEGNPAMLIWLGKNWLKQSDKVEMTHEHKVFEVAWEQPSALLGYGEEPKMLEQIEIEGGDGD